MQKKVYMKNVVAVLTLHVGAVIAILFFPSWHGLLLAVVVYTVSLWPGISIGWHRLLTHSAFKTSRLLERTLTVCGYLALQGSAIWWVAVHRLHHQKTDIPGEDPHSPRDGKWWSHILWILYQDPKLREARLMLKYAPDLCRDKFQLFLSKYPWLSVAILALVVLVTLGPVDVLWAVFVPIAFGLHATWMVNSVTHMWGSQRFNNGDDSRNNWWVALFTFGEGWHNNHHQSPTSARHGFKWWELDLSWLAIKFLRFCKLAKDVREF